MESVPGDLKPIPFRFWNAISGREPVRDWLNGFSRDDQKTVGRDIAKVQFGWPIGLPLCRLLGGGLWEIRTSLPGRREVRIMICFHDGVLIALHSFVKKSQKTPLKELALAKQRMKELTR